MLFFILAFSIQSKTIFEDVTEKMKANIKKVKFENGLTLLMMKNATSPTLALYSKFKVGSVDETPEIAGTAHLLEHMLFKGTKLVGTSDYAAEEKYHEQIKITGSRLDKLKLRKRNLTNAGYKVPEELEKKISLFSERLKSLQEKQNKYIIKAEDSYIYEQHGQMGFNAYTSHDVTNYQIRLPANRLEIWAKMESDRLKNPILREYYTERDVIMEERRMRVDNRGPGLIREKYLAAAFTDHPYGRPVIGYESNIAFLDIFETEKFFKTHYTPDNMVIAIVGDLDFNETESIIKKYFSDIPASAAKDINDMRIFEKYNQGEKRVSFKYPGGSLLLMGWHKPAYPHPDSKAFSIIDSVLAGGTSSRLYKRLVLQEKILTGVDAWSTDPGERYMNLFTVYAQLNSDSDPAKVETIIWEEIEKMKTEPVTAEELQKVKNKLTSELIRELDSNGSLADNLSYYELLTGNWEDLFKSYDSINNVSEEDIKRIMKKYFVKENLTIGYLDGKPSKETKKSKE